MLTLGHDRSRGVNFDERGGSAEPIQDFGRTHHGKAPQAPADLAEKRPWVHEALDESMTEVCGGWTSISSLAR